MYNIDDTVIFLGQNTSLSLDEIVNLYADELDYQGAFRWVEVIKKTNK